LKNTVKRMLGSFLSIVFICANALGQTPQTAPQQPAARGGRGQREAPPARIVTFEAKPASIRPGESFILVWGTENPSGVTIEPGIGVVTARGSKQLTPAQTTTYTLTVRGPNNTVATKTVTVNVAGTTPLAAAPDPDPTPAGRAIPRMPDGKPDLSGVYDFRGPTGGGRGAGNATRGAAPNAPPRTPTLKPGAEKYRVVRGPQDTGRLSDCMPILPPGSFTVPYQFQIVQSKDFVVILHEYPGVFRLIPTDGQPHPVDPDPTWLGDSVGRWEGDTLVVDTIGFNDKTEINGYRHTEALHMVERFRRTEDALEYEVTIEDPNVFVEPWTETRSFRLMPELKKIMEFVCENNRDYRVLFGPQQSQPNR